MHLDGATTPPRRLDLSLELIPSSVSLTRVHPNTAVAAARHHRGHRTPHALPQCQIALPRRLASSSRITPPWTVYSDALELVFLTSI